jgi:hypothetical protein
MDRRRSRSRSNSSEGEYRPRRILNRKSNFSSTLEMGKPMGAKLTTAEVLENYKKANPQS